MMPLHPPGRRPVDTLAEDREAILLADRLGYTEAYVGEHVTDLAENITSCLMFLASLAHDTKNMPVVFAGGGFKHGQHLAFDRGDNYPLPNLYVSMLQRLGLETDKFASSTGTMRGLQMA